MKNCISFFLLLTALCLNLQTQAQPVTDGLVEGQHVDAQLVAQQTAAVPGDTLWVALRLIHQEHWHTYWKNPGDAGLPTSINWSLPEGVTVGEIVWPVPERFDLPQDLVDFGYEDEIFLLTRLTIPAGFSAPTFELGAKAAWLECEEICIPGGAEVSLSLPVANSAAIDERWSQGFATTLAEQPREDITLDSMFTIIDGNINLLVQATEPLFDEVESVQFIPGEHRVFDYLDNPDVTYQLSSLQLSQAYHKRVADNLPETITGLLLVQEKSGVLDVYHIAAKPEGVDYSNLEGLFAPPVANLSMPMVFLFALLGGVILNLMPCVFPVLSLKILSLSENHDSPRSEQVGHALVYTAGVVLAFLALAGILLSLQATGAAVGWGFHLQAPWFVATLSVLFLVMALSLSGLLELGSRFMGIGSDLSQQSGYRGSFFTGVLASVVASPCTAPFMGAALGIAFIQPPLIGLTIFAALGLGMALPFLLISAVPALGKLLPRPGKWMVTFKHVMALPLYATVAWLLWVLWVQVGNAGLMLVALTGVLLSLALWIRQRATSDKEDKPTWRYGSVSMLLSTAVFAVIVLQSPWLEARAGSGTAGGNYEVFSEARLAELRAQGKPVFVNMTASWCITCLVNERVALSSDAVTVALEEQGVTYLKGDWTNNDPEITAVLKRYQTSGVPLYLMFPADASAAAEQLPQILTEGIVLDALTRI